MRNILIMLSLLINSVVLGQVTIPVDFEQPPGNYTFVGFNGSDSAIEANPDQSGDNESANVMRALKTDGSAVFAGTFIDLDEPINFDDGTVINIDSWSPNADITVRIALENQVDGNQIAVDVVNSAVNSWETLAADFDGLINPDVDYDRVIVIFDFDVVGDGSTYYFDNIDQSESDGGGNDDDVYCSTTVQHLGLPAETASAIILTIENVDANSMIVHITSADDDPVDVLVIPAASGAVIGPEDLSVPGEISRTLTWDNPPTDVMLNVLWSKESFGGNWQLSPGDVTIPFNSTCDGETSELDLPVTFENENIDYTLVDFAGAASQVVVDPTDASNTVAQTIRTDMADTFAGTSVGADGLANPIPFSPPLSTKLSVRVWSPEAGIPVRLKVENAVDSDISVETETTTTVAEDWETLEFDFANNVAATPAIDFGSEYSRVLIFFNFGALGTDVGEQIFYWDDVQFVPGEDLDQVDLPLTFEDDNVAYLLGDFAGTFSTIEEDPTDPSNTVARTIRGGGSEVFAGTTIGGVAGFANPVPFAPPVDTKLSVRVWSPEAGIPVRLKLENASVSAVSVETESVTTTAMEWETLEFDFINNVPGTPGINFSAEYSKAIIFFNFGAEPGTVDDQTFYWDDMEFVPGPDVDQIDLPVTFEDENVAYLLSDFAGTFSTIVEDPVQPSNTVAQTVRGGGSEVFAGTTIGGVAGFASEIPFEEGSTFLNMRVWSPEAGIPVRLKVENQGDPSQSVETETSVTVAEGWQTIGFDFSNEVAGTPALNFDFVYSKATIFFNFGVEPGTVGDQTFYWDDLQFGPGPEPFTVFDVIANSDDHETLETALGAAELVDALNGAGPFTVFAPTDDAFDALPDGMLDMLLDDPTGDLQEILLYHVLGQQVPSANIVEGPQTSLQGEDIMITIDGTDVFVNEILVSVVDLFADNGVVHVIDGVMLPPSFIEGLEELSSNSSIHAWPNPATDLLNVEFISDGYSNAQLTVYDLSGRMIDQLNPQNKLSRIDLSNYDAGQYILRIDTENAGYYHKFIISK